MPDTPNNPMTDFDGPDGGAVYTPPVTGGGKSVSTTGYIDFAIVADRIVLYLGGTYDQLIVQTESLTAAWPSGPTPVVSVKFSADNLRYDALATPVNISTNTISAAITCTGIMWMALEVTTAGTGKLLATITATKTQ